jgi:hypothetical protein
MGGTVGAVGAPAAVRSAATRPAGAPADRSLPGQAGPVPSPLVRTAYLLVHDSSGWHASKGAQVDLLFSAGGQAFIYAADATEALGEPGTYSYSGGRLSLDFHTSDIAVDATFPLPLAQSTVTMPFQVFSSKQGTSVWQQKALSIDEGAQAVFNAADNPASGASPTEQAAGPAYAYAEAWAAASPLPTAAAQKTQAPLVGACAPDGSNCIAKVQDLGEDIQITYNDGTSVLVQLYSWSAGWKGFGLSESPLASDPRVDLDPSVHPDGQFDPKNKAAALIFPYTYSGMSGPPGISAEEANSIDSTLQEHHYKVTMLENTAASVKAIADAIKSAPGFILFLTHGNQNGYLDTGETVAGKASAGMKAVEAATAAESALLSKQDLGTLVTYGANNGKPGTFVLTDENCSFLAWSSCEYRVTLKPAFWMWAQRYDSTEFTDSFVFIDACSTDSTNSLRELIRAKAYFAWQSPTNIALGDTVAQYFVESLVHPTRSPEEVFYNMRRIQATKMMIYKEDSLFDWLLGMGTSRSIIGNLDGWGWNGASLVPYLGSGWLSDQVDQSQVWWMLYAGRWDRDAAAGAANLARCLDDYWSKGEPGGLADEFCNSANSGQLTNKQMLRDDVNYAIYLLDGQKPAGFDDNDIVPRWTLDDSA